MGVSKGNHQIDIVSGNLIDAFGRAPGLFDADFLQYPAYFGRNFPRFNAGAEYSYFWRADMLGHGLSHNTEAGVVLIEKENTFFKFSSPHTAFLLSGLNEFLWPDELVT